MGRVEDQAYEADWWGSCTRTFGEEAKQITYALHMGLDTTGRHPYTGEWPCYDLSGKSVLDIGGGPVSMLLKTINGKTGKIGVVDPCPYPEWVSLRYVAAGISWWRSPAEVFTYPGMVFDEVWIYNVLQHVEDPEKVIDTARQHGKLLRIFEWLDTPPALGHPHTITKTALDAWIGNSADGTAGWVDANGAVGKAYWGVFGL